MLVYYHLDEKNGPSWTFPGDKFELNSFLINSNVTAYLIIDTAELKDNSFIKAYEPDWNVGSGNQSTLTFNINTGIEIVKNKMRAKRIPLLAALDIEYQRATETTDQTKIQEIVAKKNVLRDITEMDFSSATDLDSLKALWPTEILGTSPF
jgi:hypothetical protein